MTEKSTPQGDDEVGYGRPPKAYQFKPGQSGNPKGRPKGPRDILKTIAKHASKKVTVVENGTEKKMPKLEVVISALFNKAAKGDVPAARLIANLIIAATELNQGDDSAGYSDADVEAILNEADWQAQLVALAEEKASNND